MTSRVTMRPATGTCRAAVLCAVLLVSVTAAGSRADRVCPGTLEDIYGDTGNAFQAAIGFLVTEGTQGSISKQSYGVALDDMVVKWREFTLEPDVTDCDVSGSCAVIELGTTNTFGAQNLLTITVVDPVPDPANDCDLDGTPDGVIDCNGNTIDDVVVKAVSEAEVGGEIAYLDYAGDDRYTGTLPTSSLSDVPGVLFLAPVGSPDPVVTVTYEDHDIDPGPAVEVCPNDADPAKRGRVQAATTVFLGDSCEVVVVGTTLTDNGDGDQIADTEETVDMQVCLLNNCGRALTGCTGRLFSNSPNVDCILDSTIDIGLLPDDDEVVCVADAFRWKMAAANRTDVNEAFDATFGFTMTCDEIDALSATQELTLPLDLDFDDGGQTPTAWTEGFEGGSLGSSSFYAENLDAGIPGQNNTEGLINGDGWRCQYSDPDWQNSNSYGNYFWDTCYPGATLASSYAVFWQVDGIDTASPDGGRAKTGDYSMYYGIYLTDPPSEFTTPLAIVESAATAEPLNLGLGSPELRWWQQVSLMDGRALSVPLNRSADRGVVQYKTVDLAGADTSPWTRLEPFQNTYSTQNYDFYYNCMFDPVDDGTTEDDFFDPDDPDRRLGPSSTCHPMFAWSCQGDTDEPFAVGNICNATTQPSAGDAGELGTGTWVQSKVDLSELRGRRIKLRFLVTGIKAVAETHDEQFPSINPGEYDNGWWIDDVVVENTLALPVTPIVDDDTVRHCAGDPAVGCLTADDCSAAGTIGPCEGEAPQCGPRCTTPALQVATEPDATGGALDETLAAPGRPIVLDAAGSSGVCLDGALLFRFSVVGGGVLREWSPNARLTEAPLEDTDYLVEVRCSADASCQSSVTVNVAVGCPSSGDLEGVFPETVLAESKTKFGWTTPREFFLFAGDLAGVGSYSGDLSQHVGRGFFAETTPAPGAGSYFVVRTPGGHCNDAGSWSSGGPGESPLREPSLP